ncbi:MAG: hypothetical protein L0Y66_22670 [Myxococcaceae bacterium]|nr:hypothetical protein [Myxococcaceae bacterium]MCI0670276.1 hypothetical protein [Myxococcaceae bacterium]
MDEARDAQATEATLAFLTIADRLFDEMVRQQHQKVVGLAREVLPYLSEEDLRNPWDFVELKSHPTFEYEDGLLNGLIAAQVALRAEFRQRLLPPTPPLPSRDRG